MGVKVAAKVCALNQFREPARCSGFNFAAVLAHLRWHPGKPQRAINLIFRLAGDASTIAKEAVFVEQESARLGETPQMHVVGLRAGEVGERGTKTLWGHYPQVHL
jgi:hypothetical protein